MSPSVTTRIGGHGGVSLAADVYGDDDARPVVLLHGGGQTRHAWGRTAETLGQRGWRALTVDLRGHGDSDWSPDGRYTLEAFAEDIVAVARTLPTPPALVGASLGGVASMTAVAESEAEIAAALVLVDVAPRLEPEGIARIGDFMRAKPEGFESLDEVADAIAAYNPHRPRPKDLSGLKKNVRLREDGRWHWHWDPAFISPSAEEPRRYTNEERLETVARQLRLPTLIVRGGQSDVLSDAGVAALKALVPHAEVAEVGGAGHMVAGDRNDAFNGAIVEFLERTVPTSA